MQFIRPGLRPAEIMATLSGPEHASAMSRDLARGIVGCSVGVLVGGSDKVGDHDIVGSVDGAP